MQVEAVLYMEYPSPQRWQAGRMLEPQGFEGENEGLWQLPGLGPSVEPSHRSRMEVPPALGPM